MFLFLFWFWVPLFLAAGWVYFLVQRLAGRTKHSWWWLTFPLWGTLLITILIAVPFAVFGYLFATFSV